MEWDLYFSQIGYSFHPGIPETQTFPNHVYIDALGVLWGVSDKFKAKHQIAEALFWWSTMNKHVN
jgi:hypothetical protein